MKIEVDLCQIHAAPELGRVAAVALLCALPQDEAELAVEEWRAVLIVRAADTMRQLDLVAPLTGATVQEAPAEAEIQLGAKAAYVLPTAVEDTPPTAGSYAKFSYGGPTFSARKGGPAAAAYRQALEDIALCSTIEELDALQSKLDALGGIFTEVGHPDRVGGLREAVSRRRDGLYTNPQPPRSVSIAPEPMVVENIEDTIPLPEPAAAEPAPVAVTNGSTDPLHAMSLRELCRHAEHEVGRDAVIEAMKHCGVTKLAGLEAGAEAALRTAVMELLT